MKKYTGPAVPEADFGYKKPHYRKNGGGVKLRKRIKKLVPAYGNLAKKKGGPVKQGRRSKH